MKTQLVVVCALAAAVGCGNDSPGGPSPQPPPPPISIAITPATDLLKIKGTETFSVTGTYSNGSTRAEQPTWGTDNAGIATIDASGRASGIASGQASIFADAQGQRATRVLRVVPDYHGRWRGDWIATGCSDEGDWRGACVDFPSGSLFGLSLDLTQTRDAISGTSDFGDDLPGAVSGTIRMERAARAERHLYDCHRGHSPGAHGRRLGDGDHRQRANDRTVPGQPARARPARVDRRQRRGAYRGQDIGQFGSPGECRRTEPSRGDREEPPPKTRRSITQRRS